MNSNFVRFGTNFIAIKASRDRSTGTLSMSLPYFMAKPVLSSKSEDIPGVTADAACLLAYESLGCGSQHTFGLGV